MFEELANTLQLWVTRLYDRLEKDNVDQVFFLSREGQPLQRMFDAYARRRASRIRSRYLEVSRRATLLPSLNELVSETFENLFRQYRAISLVEFLSSLGLEDELAVILDDIDLKSEEGNARQVDFPTSPIFIKLRKSNVFLSVYETRRLEQRAQFLDYLERLAGGVLPSTLVVVDVGWKGTIQDNLHALLCKHENPLIECVKGFYVGLIAPGSAGPTNIKSGLLFSCVGARSYGFQVFNENKSLFEVILAADHGSVVGYGSSPDGAGMPVRGLFDEREMLEQSVFPVLRHVEERFLRLISAQPSEELWRLSTVVDGHARMVFHPSAVELAWFDAIFHVENFGVFERSYFSSSAGKLALLSRLSFLLRLFRRRNVGELGFWPWATLYRRAGRIPASVYGAIRQWQARRGANG